jgi:hypothetical protein
MCTLTCKYSKRVALVLGRSDWTATEWACAIVVCVIDLDWGLPKVLLSDWYPKFLSELWAAIFDIVRAKLLFSTAYHPQTDGQSEGTN